MRVDAPTPMRDFAALVTDETIKQSGEFATTLDIWWPGLSLVCQKTRNRHGIFALQVTEDIISLSIRPARDPLGRRAALPQYSPR